MQMNLLIVYLMLASAGFSTSPPDGPLDSFFVTALEGEQLSIKSQKLKGAFKGGDDTIIDIERDSKGSVLIRVNIAGSDNLIKVNSGKKYIIGNRVDAIKIGKNYRFYFELIDTLNNNRNHTCNVDTDDRLSIEIKPKHKLDFQIIRLSGCEEFVMDLKTESVNSKSFSVSIP